MFSNTLLALLALSPALVSVHAHGTFVQITGANGVNGLGFGVLTTTPRDGTKRNPFQQDTSIIKDRDIASGKTGVCGRTLAGGNNDVAAQLAAASNAGLPTPAADGTITMVLHQINGDGAGPYTCDVSGDGGNTFTPATVTQQVPGRNGRSNAKATNFTVTATMPAGMDCAAGPNGDACIIRCRNPVGPFGSCMAVGSADSAATATASNSTASTGTAAASNSTAAAASSTDSAAATASNSTDAAAAAAAAAPESSAAAAASESNAAATEAPASAASAAASESTAAATEASAAAASSATESAASGTVDGTADSDADTEDPADAASTSTGAGAGAAGGAAGGLAGLLGGAGAGAGATGGAGAGGLAGLLGKLGGGATARAAPRRRYINSRVAGKRAGYWI